MNYYDLNQAGWRAVRLSQRLLAGLRMEHLGAGPRSPRLPTPATLGGRPKEHLLGSSEQLSGHY